ncbi:MAG TPA: methyltransferase type 12, partial [Allocoleopsis sp.]
MSIYIGHELELFECASNWKTYYGSKVKKYLGNSVFEVGAGIGGTTKYLWKDDIIAWTCIEPDPNLMQNIEAKIENG